MIEKAKRTLVLDKEIEHITNWIRNYFADNGPTSYAVIGISGGKDSTIAAALCARAIGPDRVIGVLMPDGEQEDIDVARRVCEYLGIDSYEINIGDTTNAFYEALRSTGLMTNSIVTNNTPARIRMAILYGLAGIISGRVVNTCNYSEEYVGYTTKWGDNVGDFAPLAKYTVREVKAIGQALGLPNEFIEKTPIDGMCGMTDEENLGFSYDILDDYILDDKIPDADTLVKIKTLHQRSKHKTGRIEKCHVLTAHRIGEEWKPEYVYF